MQLPVNWSHSPLPLHGFLAPPGHGLHVSSSNGLILSRLTKYPASQVTAMDVKPDIIAAGCPFCNTMMTDGVKNKAEGQIEVMDVAELIANANDL